VELTKINNTKSTILAKLEALNPSGSIKDVMALYMIDIAEKNGMLKPGNQILEATSGNTGIAFAMIAPLKGCKFVAIMQENMSKERRQMMQAFGAEIVLTPEKEGFIGALERLEQLAKENQDAWLPRQFDNPDNIAAHWRKARLVTPMNGRLKQQLLQVALGADHGALLAFIATWLNMNDYARFGETGLYFSLNLVTHVMSQL